MKPEEVIHPINKTITFNPLKEPRWKDAEWNFKGNHDEDYTPVDDPVAIQKFLEADYPLPRKIRNLALPVIASISVLTNSVSQKISNQVNSYIERRQSEAYSSQLSSNKDSLKIPPTYNLYTRVIY